MSIIPEDLKYTREHEWIRLDDEGLTGICGITDYKQEMLTDIMFVEFPSIDDQVRKGQRVVLVDSATAYSNVYTPVSGKIIGVNRQLEEEPRLINRDPYGEGWIFEIDVTKKLELDELLNSIEYSEYLESGD